MADLTEVNDLAARKRNHICICAFVGAASVLAKRLIQERSMLPRRYPDLRAVVFGVKCGCTDDLAGVADGVFMGCGVPINRGPLSGHQMFVGSANQNRDMLGIQVMAMQSTISGPKMVKMQLNGRMIRRRWFR